MTGKERAALKFAAEILEKNRKKYINNFYFYGTDRKKIYFDDALSIIQDIAYQEPTFKEVLDDAVNDLKKEKDASWIPVTESLPDSSRYILLSFENHPVPAIGRCETDEDGNSAFYLGDDYRPLVKRGIFVNAWMELPERYHD